MEESVKKRYSFPHKLVWILNLLFIAALALSYLSCYVSPERIWWLAFFGLAYGSILVGNLVFVAVWIWRRSRKFLVSLSVCVLGTGHFLSIYEPGIFRAQAPPADRYVQPLNVMTFNVRLFNLYQLQDEPVSTRDFYRFLRESAPDVVCFQEFFSGKNKIADTLHKVLVTPYSHIRYSAHVKGLGDFGMATYSKYPIVHQGYFKFRSRTGNIVQYTDIAVGDDTIRIFNTHLESIRFKKEDYHFIENLGNEDVEQDEIAGSMNILRRLKRAFLKRSRQVEILKAHIHSSPYRVILCGDFNDTPVSYTHSVLTSELKDAFRISGRGWGRTYSGSFPSFRIDYILHDKSMKSFEYNTHKVELSDHYPVSCMVTWKKPGL
jgi:endonuclease/exonuclease/phosphatase family metal-dependent hydrolase